MNPLPGWLQRGLLAGPLVAATALAVMCALAEHLPGGPGGADGVAVATIALPVLWSMLVLHALLDARLTRVWVSLLLLLSACVLSLAWVAVAR